MIAQRTGLGRIARVLFDKQPTSFCRFVGYDQKEVPPRNIRDSFRQTVILNHPGNAQLFNVNFIKLPDQTVRNLVVKMLPCASNAQVMFSQQVTRFRTPFPVSLSPRNNLARAGESLFVGTQSSRVVNKIAGRESGKCGQTNVNADSSPCFRQWNGLDNFANQLCVPAVNALENPKNFYLRVAWQLSRESYTYSTNTPDGQLVTAERETFALINCVLETVVSVSAFESWKPRCLARLAAAKESIVGFLHALHYISLNVTGNACVVGVIGAQLSQLSALFNPIRRLACVQVGTDSLLQASVVQLAATPQHVVSRRDKCLIRAKLEFVNFIDCVIVSVSHCVLALIKLLFGQGWVSASTLTQLDYYITI